MAKQNLSEQLDLMVEAALAGRGAASRLGDKKLAAFAEVVSDLRDLPRADLSETTASRRRSPPGH